MPATMARISPGLRREAVETREEEEEDMLNEKRQCKRLE
jgi:hypothetical protein